MATNKQIEANRANATKSTGPKSQAGKARSRLNSRKHGLTAKNLVIAGECADDFDQLRAELMDEHDPQSALECELVERLVGILWRLRRVPFFEAAIMDARHFDVSETYMISIYQASRTEEIDVEKAKRSVRFGHALINDAQSNDALGKLGRNEAMLMNSLTKTLLLLQQNCGNRKDGPVTIEAVALPPAA
jgi:hypothetical protein